MVDVKLFLISSVFDLTTCPQVCVVVPAQRAAALGLSHHPTHALSSCSSRGSPPSDLHFIPLGSGSGGSGYPSHTRSHSLTPSSSSSGHGVSSGVVGYGQYEHHPHTISAPPHHHSTSSHKPVTNHSYGGGGGGGHGHGHSSHSSVHMPPVHQQQPRRRGRGEPRGHLPAHCVGGQQQHQQSRSSTYPPEYERCQQQSQGVTFSHSTSYPPPGWSGDGPAARGMRHDALRSQSPPTLMPSEGRSGGGLKRPPPTPPRGYELPYSRYNSSAGPGHGSGLDALPAGLSVTGRRHSGSSVMSSSSRISGLSSVSLSRQDGGGGGSGGGLSSSPSSSYSQFYMPTPDDIMNERASAYEREFGYAGPSRMP